MVDLIQKKLTKLIGLKKSEFNQYIIAKEISLNRPHLIPFYKLGDELALTSVLLSSFRLIKEFKDAIFSEAKIQRGGSLYVYTEVSFKDHPESRLDGLILIVKAGTIRDAIILEVKNGKNLLEKNQLERYQKIAKQYSISKFITISNQFVSNSSQSPVAIKKIKDVDLYHFSWSYLLTIAHVLLFKNDTNIEDEDQVEIMKEIVNYFEHPKSGVLGVNQMNSGWVDVVSKINAGECLKKADKDVHNAALSWHQEERDMALILSRELGVLVSSGTNKYKRNLLDRLDDDCKNLITNSQLESTFKIKGAASDINIIAQFEKRTVEMITTLQAPSGKTHKGQLGWIKKQLDSCAKKNNHIFELLSKQLYFEVSAKNSRNSDRFSIFNFESAIDNYKGKEIREFKIILLKDFGRRFSSPKKFVSLIENMLIDYYKCIVQHLKKWEPNAPKITKKETLDDERFIDEVNNDKPITNSTKTTTPISSHNVIHLHHQH